MSVRANPAMDQESAKHAIVTSNSMKSKKKKKKKTELKKIKTGCYQSIQIIILSAA